MTADELLLGRDIVRAFLEESVSDDWVQANFPETRTISDDEYESLMFRVDNILMELAGRVPYVYV